jgi:hypothetical protein
MVVRRSIHRPVGAYRQTTPRHLWLAALGAIAVARREAGTALEIVLEETGKLRRQATQFAGDARDLARGVAMTLGEKAEPQVGRFSAEVEARLAPVLDKLGVQVAGRKPARKARTAVKKPSQRRASPRTQAAVRVARKGRGA